jgi:hypothetical protein
MYSGGWLTPLHTFDQKVEYGLKSLSLYSELNDFPGTARTHYSLGIAYANRASYKTAPDTITDSYWYGKALYHNRQAERYFNILKDHDGIADALASQGENEIALGHPGNALNLLLKAQAGYDSSANNIGLAIVKWQQALIHRSVKETVSSLRLVRESEGFLLKAGYTAMLFELYDLETSLHREANNFERALESSMRARKARDEYYSYQRNSLIAEIQNRYENQLRDEKIRVLDAENKLKQTRLNESQISLWSAISAFFIIVFSLLIYLWQRGRILRQERINHELSKILTTNLETQLADAQLTAARTQMNPHFVFNSINAIQSLILEENNTQAIAYLNEFSKLTRETLDNSSRDTISLREEISFLNHYLQLEQLRSANLFSFKIETENVDEDYDCIPPMLVQPLVENAIHHGILPKGTTGVLAISFIKHEEDVLMVIVDDDGIGRAAAKSAVRNHKYKSKALQLTEFRMQLMNEREKKSVAYPIQFEDKTDESGMPAGTRVSITIPLGFLTTLAS